MKPFALLLLSIAAVWLVVLGATLPRHDPEMVVVERTLDGVTWETLRRLPVCSGWVGFGAVLDSGGTRRPVVLRVRWPVPSNCDTRGE